MYFESNFSTISFPHILQAYTLFHLALLVMIKNYNDLLRYILIVFFFSLLELTLTVLSISITNILSFVRKKTIFFFSNRSSYADIGGAVWPRYGKQLTLSIQAVELLLVTTLFTVVAVSVLRVLITKYHIPSIGWILIIGLVLYPNVFIRHMWYISLVSKMTVISAAMIMLAVVVYCLITISEWKHPPMFTVSSLKDYISGVGILIGSFSSQMYLSVIESSMAEPERIKTVMSFGFITSIVLKGAIGVFAYMRFGDRTADIITLNLPHDTFFTVVNVCVLFLALSSYSLPMFTVFDILENDSNLLGKNLEDRSFKKYRRYGIRSLLYLIPSLLTIMLPCIFYVILHWDHLTKLELSFNMILISSSIMFTFVGTYFSGLDMINAFKNNVQDVWSI